MFFESLIIHRFSAILYNVNEDSGKHNYSSNSFAGLNTSFKGLRGREHSQWHLLFLHLFLCIEFSYTSNSDANLLLLRAEGVGDERRKGGRGDRERSLI